MDSKRMKEMTKYLFFTILIMVSCKANRVHNGVWVSDADWLQYSIRIEISRKDKISVTYFNNPLYAYGENSSQDLPARKEGVLIREEQKIIFDNSEDVMYLWFLNSNLMMVRFNDGTSCDFIKEH